MKNNEKKTISYKTQGKFVKTFRNNFQENTKENIKEHFQGKF